MKAWDAFKKLTPTGRWISAGVTVVLVGFLIWLTSAVVYRLFYQGQDLKKAEGTAIVAGEQQKAEGNIAGNAMAAMKEREVYHETVRTIVQQGRSNVDDSWKGETVGADVDRAGADALCKLHDSLCRQPPAAPVQQVRGPVPRRDASLQAPG